MQWTPTQLQQLADAYSALNPTWTPPAADNAALPNPIQPVKFDPNLDPGYAAQASALQTIGQHAQNEYDYQTAQGSQTYGYDTQGNLSGLNPYSQAAILKRNYDNTVRGTTNNYASQGQLYSTAIQNAQNANDYNYGQSSDALQRAAQAFYHQNTLNLQGTQDNSTLQLAQLLGPAFQNFLAQQQRGS